MIDTCAIDIDIKSGAQNHISWSTLSNIAQSIVTTCGALPGSPGGWGIYGEHTSIAFLEYSNYLTSHYLIGKADVYVVVNNPDSPNKPKAPANQFTWSASSTATAPPTTSTGLTADTQAYFIGSFWGYEWTEWNLTVCETTPVTYIFNLTSCKNHSPRLRVSERINQTFF